MNIDIFISYSRKDLELVKNIKTEIEKSVSTECWMDLNGIESGAEVFIDNIVQGIEQCRVFLFMLSEYSQTSEYAMKELKFAYEEARVNRNKHVVIVNINGCQMIPRFRFMYGLADIKDWNNRHQHDKLIRDLTLWIVKNELKTEVPVVTEKPQQMTLLPYKDTKGKYGYKDAATGKVVIPCQWNNAGLFTEGYAVVEDGDGKWGYIDKYGRIAIPCQWVYANDFSEGCATVVESYGKCGFIDKSGHIVIPCRWNDSKAFSEGYAAVEDGNGKWGYIDKSGRIVIPCQWELASDFSEGYAAVEDGNNKYGFIDKSGRTVIPYRWPLVSVFFEDYSWVQIGGGKHGYIDKSGHIVVMNA